MTPPCLLVLRADASPERGAGHVMRCLALAMAWREAGGQAVIAARTGGIGWLVRDPRLRGILLPLPGSLPHGKECPEDLLQQITNTLVAFGPTPGPDSVRPFVVLDGYHFAPDCHNAVRKAGYGLMVVDDYNHLDCYHADILLNQNPGSELLAYQAPGALKLFGPRHALLRPEYLAASSLRHSRIVKEFARNILVTLGGGDQSYALEALAPLFSHRLFENRCLRVLCGAMEARKALYILSRAACTVEAWPSTSDMPGLIGWADFTITAAGSTCWELCFLGTSFVAIQTAENQRQVVAGLEELGVAACLGDASNMDLSRAAEIMERTLTNVTERSAGARSGMELVDGHGARRCVEVILSLPG